jgi:hypothetical protein
MECLGLHNKSTAEVHPGHMLTGPKEKEEESVDRNMKKTEPEEIQLLLTYISTRSCNKLTETFSRRTGSEFNGSRAKFGRLWQDL